MHLDRFSLNSMTVPRLDLPGLIEQCERLGIDRLAPWRPVIADAGGAAAAERSIRAAGLRLSSLCRGGMFTAPDDPSEAGRAAAVVDNLRAIDDAATLGAPVLVLVCGPVVGRDVAGSLAMICDGIAAVLPHAQAAGVCLGIEPLHPMMAADRSAVCRVADATDLIDELGRPEGLGVVVDAYHVWWDQGLAADLERVGDRVLGFHVSDWVSPLTGGLTSGRGIMGEGCIDLAGLECMVASAGYSGAVEVEVISDQYAAEPPAAVLDRCVAGFTAI